MTERAKVTRRECDPPRSIHKWSMLQAKQKVSIKIENVNVAKPVSMVFIPRARLAMGEGYNDIAADVLNTEWRIVGRKVCILERTGHRDGLEVAVVHLHLRSREIGGVQPHHRMGLCDCASFVDGPFFGVVHFNDRIGRIDAWVPAGNGAILCDEEEDRWLPGLGCEHLGE